MDYPLAKEQAVLSLLIQEARREMESLKIEKELFLQEREGEAVARVVRALDEAKGMVEETKEYIEAVNKLRQEAENILSELKSSKEFMQEARRDFKNKSKETTELLSKRAVEMQEVTASIQLEKVRLNGLLESLRSERKMLADEQKKVDDDRGKLKAAMQIWQKQKETITE